MNDALKDYIITAFKIEYTRYARVASEKDNKVDIVITIPEDKSEGLLKILMAHITTKR